MTDNNKEEMLAILQVAIENEFYTWHKEQVSVLNTTTTDVKLTGFW